MKKRIRVLCVIGLFLCGLFAVGSASGAMVNNNNVNTFWGELGNWFDFSTSAPATHLPTTSTDINLKLTMSIETGTNAEALKLWIGPWAGTPGELTVNSGSLDIADYTFVGGQDVGKLTVNSGQIDVYNQLLIGANASATGTMYMNGGTVNISQQGLFIGGDGTGHLEITGGTINTPNMDFGIWGGGSGTINFSGDGEIIIQGTARLSDVENWIGDGTITNAQVNEVNGNTVISQIPEPATFALLGLGSMTIFRRRKQK